MFIDFDIVKVRITSEVITDIAGDTIGYGITVIRSDDKVLAVGVAEGHQITMLANLGSTIKVVDEDGLATDDFLHFTFSIDDLLTYINDTICIELLQCSSR